VRPCYQKSSGWTVCMHFLFCNWIAVGDLTVSKLLAEQSVALLMLAGSLLVFRTFRERYLLLWILGWLAYFVSQGTLLGTSAEPRYVVAISHAEFVLAICLFAAAVFQYTHSPRLIMPLLAAGVCFM